MPAQTINLLDYLKAFWRRKIGFALIVALFVSGGIVYSFCIPELYRAEAIITPVSSGGGKSLDSTGLLANIPAFLGGGGGGASANFLMYLKSQTLRIQVVKALDLLPLFIPKNSPLDQELSEAQKLNWAATILGSMVAIESDRVFTSQIKIASSGPDREQITKIVTQYLVELQNFITNNSLTQAKRSRFFLEEQLARIKEEMLENGKEMAVLYGRSNVSKEQAKLNVPVALKTGEGVQNFTSYEEFKKHFDVLQKKEAGTEASQNVRYVKDVPHQIYLKYMSAQQEILEVNYNALTQSYQMAKLEEVKQEPSFQVLAEPITPLYKYYPNRKKMAMISMLLGCVAGSLYIFYCEVYLAGKRGPLSVPSLEEQEALA